MTMPKEDKDWTLLEDMGQKHKKAKEEHFK